MACQMTECENIARNVGKRVRSYRQLQTILEKELKANGLELQEHTLTYLMSLATDSFYDAEDVRAKGLQQ